ncbi:MAG: type II toxin-antitoxin system HicB family antitoxin [Thermodesulfobacteriota bacterium]|nr:type II toxin-antitoxin system HicB family antitoxin [Thermodesulfobacteriota bacterium]
MLNQFTYPITLTPDEEDGGYVVTFPDIPMAITQGDTIEECLEVAVDCLEEALSCFIDEGELIPEPSPIAANGYSAAPSAQVALKTAVYLAWKEEGISKTELATRMGAAEAEARRILDPRHGTKLPTLERALEVLGKRIELKVA